MSDKHLELWNSVEKTDPQYTKKVDARGGFTSICAQYQMKMATEQFGTYGKNWGVHKLNYHFINGLPDKNGFINSREIVLDAVFFYPEGSFEIGTEMVYKAGQDTRKKLLTDLTTKALSKLGFNADVFMGMFDDNKYVNNITNEKNLKERYSILYSLERRLDDKEDDQEAAYKEYESFPLVEIEDSIDYWEREERKQNAIKHANKIIKQTRAKSSIDGNQYPTNTKDGLRELLKSTSKSYGVFEEVTKIFTDKVEQLENESVKPNG